jgi:hypothetical protein
MSTPNSKLSRLPFAREYPGRRVLPYYAFPLIILIETLSGSIFVVRVVYIAVPKRPSSPVWEAVSSAALLALRILIPMGLLATVRVLCGWYRAEYRCLHPSNKGPVSCYFISNCDNERPDDLLQPGFGDPRGRRKAHQAEAGGHRSMGQKI